MCFCTISLCRPESTVEVPNPEPRFQVSGKEIAIFIASIFVLVIGILLVSGVISTTQGMIIPGLALNAKVTGGILIGLAAAATALVLGIAFSPGCRKECGDKERSR